MDESFHGNPSQYISSDNVKGVVLALSSSLFIGASFIVKKKGLKKAGSSNLRAGTHFLLSFNFLIDVFSAFLLLLFLLPELKQYIF